MIRARGDRRTVRRVTVGAALAVFVVLAGAAVKVDVSHRRDQAAKVGTPDDTAVTSPPTRFLGHICGQREQGVRAEQPIQPRSRASRPMRLAPGDSVTSMPMSATSRPWPALLTIQVCW
jgi:hypothetical protein